MTDSVEILTKLFDTLKDASEKNEKATQKLVEQQIFLVGKIRNMPIDELKAALIEHTKNTENDFDECNGVIELKTAELKDILSIILNKINKIILVFSVIVAVMTSGYFILRYAAESDRDTHNEMIADDQLEQLKQELEEDRNRIIEQLKQEMGDLHKENDIKGGGSFGADKK